MQLNIESMAAGNSHPRHVRFAEFRFYEELNDFLPANRRKISFRFAFSGNPSVKDTIQAMGVPHTEIDLILVDGRSVNFCQRLRGGERVAVYPVFERLDISPVIRLRPRPLRDTRFILDVHLGKLVRYLRMLGLDATHDRDWDHPTIIDLSLQEERIILTRSLEVLKQNRVTHGYWLRQSKPRLQLKEVVTVLDLFGQFQPFMRCMDCNGGISLVDKAAVRERINPDIFQRFREFQQCQKCGKIYWHGSHHRKMVGLISDLYKSKNTC